MPILNRDDAVEVEERIKLVFAASPAQRAVAVRRLFVEVLDFNAASGQVSLAGATGPVQLPAAAERVAELGGVHVLYIALPDSATDRIRKAEVDAAARCLADQLGDDLLLVCINPPATQLHLILPDFTGARPTLRRLVLERGLPCRTAIEQVSNIYWNYQIDGNIRTVLTGAFNVQPVTEAFFKDYKTAYAAAVARLSAAGLAQAAAEQFTQTLFNRLLFIHFVSKKGWLTFGGEADYLNALWYDYRANPAQTNFYTSRLVPLFFAGLNNPQSLDLRRDNPALYAHIGAVPFLNGGLFEETPLDQQAAQGVFTVPDESIAPLLTDLFNRYNFTVMEATPLDTEVAVDPEMLGKLFEETVNERHSSGAYYTPRPVVSFMCREALKGYLAGRNIPGLDAAGIADLVDRRNPDAITPPQALETANALADIKTVDPACGSGAFLLGMMQEILALNDSLFRAGHTPASLYRQKLDIITNNIYGADQDPLAVSTAMLRLWLSLAVDYDGDGPPDPLPNLDLKLVAGDAIAGPNPQQLDFTRQSIADSGLQRDIAGYTTAYGRQKDTLKQRVAATKAQLRGSLQDAAPAQVVEWRIDFADVMLNGGFDVVIANPPYVRQEEIAPRAYKEALLKAYPDAATLRSDLYCYFYARALQLLKAGGMHVFVCSNSWLDVGYGARLQEHLLNNAHVRAIYESAVERQFSTADINTIISVSSKTAGAGAGEGGEARESGERETRFVSLRADFDTALADPEQRREIRRNRAELQAAGARGGQYAGDKWGGKYLRAPDIYHHLLAKCASQLVRLGDIATVRFGIKTGANEFFYLTKEKIAEFGIEPEFRRPVMTTPQESRRIAVNPAYLPKQLFMCHQSREVLKGKGALEYIKWGEAQGYQTRRSVAARRRWYDLGERETTQLAINRRMDTTSRTFIAEQGLFVGDTLYEISTAMPYAVCAALNSTFFQLIINVEGRTNFGAGVLEIEVYEASNIQIVNPRLLPEPEAAGFAATDWDVLRPSAARRDLDGAVFDALSLTGEERAAVYAGVGELVGNRKRRAGSV